MIDISSLERALQQLEAGLDRARAAPGDEVIRDGVIQRFEYSYELCHKMLKRYLEATEPSRELIETLTFPDLIRTGWERGLLLQSWDKWKNYRTARNATSHAYDSKKASEVFAIIPDFLDEARYLRDQLSQRQAGT